MNSVTGKFIMFMAIIFLAFRTIITVLSQFEIDFYGIVPFNFNYEIIVIFISIFALILVGKHKIVGGVVYLITNTLYYGQYITLNILDIINSESNIELVVYFNIMIAMVGIAIALVIVMQQIFDKHKEFSPTKKDTEWFLANEKYEREKDERADKNNYKTI